MRRRTLIRRLSHGLVVTGLAFWVAMVGMYVQSPEAGGPSSGPNLLHVFVLGGLLVIAGFGLWIIANVRDGRKDSEGA